MIYSISAVKSINNKERGVYDTSWREKTFNMRPSRLVFFRRKRGSSSQKKWLECVTNET